LPTCPHHRRAIGPRQIAQVLIVAIDHLSDFDRRWRTSVEGNMNRLALIAVNASPMLGEMR